MIPGLFLVASGLTGIVVTYSGPAFVTDTVVIDVHAYVFFVFAAMLGAQFLMFGVLMRRVAGMYNIKPAAGSFQRGIARFATLEYSLGAALAGLLTGAAGAYRCFAEWQSTGFAPMAYGALLKPFILSLAILVVSVQLVATAFFAASLQEYTAHKVDT